MINRFLGDWGFYTLITQLPKFLDQTLHFDLAKTGFLAALPYVVLTLLTFPVSCLADYLRKNWLSTTMVRRIFQSIALTGEASFMLCAAIIAHPTYSVVCLVCAVGMASFYTSGYCCNALDIAPQYASIIMGLSNTCGTLTGIISPTLSGYIVQNKTVAEWNIVFITSACVLMSGCIFYFFFGSGELQDWAKVHHKLENADDDKSDVKKV